MTPLESNNFKDFLRHITESLEPPIRYEIEPSDKTVVMHISPESESTYLLDDEELMQWMLTKVTLTSWGLKRDVYPESTVFVTADIDGAYVRWVLISGTGEILDSDESWDKDFGS